jgi:hypothetical protein
MKGHGFTGCEKTSALPGFGQGTPSAIPFRPNQNTGFSP